jgi:hypothetical protein
VVVQPLPRHGLRPLGHLASHPDALERPHGVRRQIEATAEGPSVVGAALDDVHQESTVQQRLGQCQPGDSSTDDQHTKLVHKGFPYK